MFLISLLVIGLFPWQASTYSFVLLREHKQPFEKNNLDLTVGQFVTFVNNASLGLGFR